MTTKSKNTEVRHFFYIAMELINYFMKSGDRFNVFHPKDSTLLGNGLMTDDKMFNIYTINGDFNRSGRFIDKERCNIYNSDGEYIQYGRMFNADRFNIWDASTNKHQGIAIFI